MTEEERWREVCDATGRLLYVEVLGNASPPMRDDLLCFCGAVSCCSSIRCARHACATFVYVADFREDGKECEEAK